MAELDRDEQLEDCDKRVEGGECGEASASVRTVNISGSGCFRGFFDFSSNPPGLKKRTRGRSSVRDGRRRTKPRRAGSVNDSPAALCAGRKHSAQSKWGIAILREPSAPHVYSDDAQMRHASAAALVPIDGLDGRTDDDVRARRQIRHRIASLERVVGDFVPGARVYEGAAEAADAARVP